jgi:RNA polymerase sigma-70 factor (ECF subfamily)
VQDLVDRIRQGDVSAESEFVRQFTHRVLVMATVRMRDREAARELVQDVLMAVIGALRKGQLQDSSKLVAFVHGTARNLINNWLRRESHRPKMESLPDDVADVGSAALMGDTERMRLVRQALERLGLKDRQILWMTLVEGRKPREIADALGLSSEVVRTRKLRAVRRVRGLIETKVSRN